MIYPIEYENLQEKDHERIETEKAQDKIDRIKLLCLELGIKWSEDHFSSSLPSSLFFK